MGTIVDDKRPRKLDNRVDNPASAADSDTVGETEELPCCLPARGAGALPLPAFDDEDGPRLGDDLPPVFDAHVHVFADALFAAIWRWFDTNGWPIRHKLTARDVVAFLRTRGVDGALLLHYAHKPGIARGMNGFVKDIVDESGGFAIGTATVCPGEPDQVAIVDDAFTAGLRGIKLHCHVQGVAVDDARLFPIYELCQSRNQVVVVHAGREPWSNALPVDPHAVCAVQRTARVIANFPRLRMVVPHLGADEFDEYAALMKSCDTLWLDTTMMVAGYFDLDPLQNDVDGWRRFILSRPDRVLYGSDFPNLPYAWDREVKALTRGLRDPVLEQVLGLNARALF